MLHFLGYCYQFNSDGSFQTNAAGNSGGITLFLDVMADEYYLSPYSFSEGFFVSLLLHLMPPMHCMAIA